LQEGFIALVGSKYVSLPPFVQEHEDVCGDWGFSLPVTFVPFLNFPLELVVLITPNGQAGVRVASQHCFFPGKMVAQPAPARGFVDFI
jgi:hypothetical protein